MGKLFCGSSALTVTGLDVVEHERTFTLVMELKSTSQRWRVRLESDRSEMAIFDGAPPYDLVRSVANSFHAHLFEWWDTKGSNRRATKLGERLD
ncbi:hypothetical protein [Streptomyces sp. NRRL B-1347]|uniref:hypothetical protein n=1 Tax=Streptomyces sp. NRRL B-1347 TaxID=1476877 RepID=UPI001F1FE276|nr:hypothetical protein [Streptomyces sp. NRRL B-1347]